VTGRERWGRISNRLAVVQIREIEGAFQMPSGSIFVPEREPKEDYIVIYARVSSSENKNKLDTQVERLPQYANARGYQVREDNKRVKG